MRSILSLLLLGATLSKLSGAGALDAWHLRHPLPQGNTLYSVAYGNGTFVAVGERGTALASTNGINWDVGKTGFDTDFSGITFGNNFFVAVGGMSVYISADGIHWVQRDPGPNDGLRAVAFGNNEFIAAGGGVLSRRNIALSSNLTDWQITSSRTARSLRAIAFGNGLFRVAGDEGEGATTVSGAGWVSGGVGTSFDLLGVAFGNGAFLDVGQAGYVNFGQLPIGQASATTNDLNGVAFAKGRFVAVGARGAIITSTNGLNWMGAVSGIDTALWGVTFGAELFVGVGEGGRIVTSADGLNWTVRSSGPIDTLHDLAAGNAKFVAVGDSGAVLVSTNGIEWVSRYAPSHANLSKICFGSGVFVALGDSDGRICTSPDGVSWSQVSFGSDTNWQSIVHGSDRFVAVGWASVGNPIPLALSSTNGYTWIPEAVGTNGGLQSVAYGAGVFVAVGGDWNSGRLILSSTDGRSWAIRDMTAAPVVRAVAYGNSRFVAIDDFNGVLTSADGVSWQTTQEVTPDRAFGLVYCNGIFLGCGYGSLFSSIDGIHWISHAAPVAWYPYPSIAAVRDSFFMIGAHGQIMQTDPIVALTLEVADQPELKIFGGIGRWHDIQATDSPEVINSWQTAGTLLLTNTPQMWHDRRSPVRKQFYRAVLRP